MFKRSTISFTINMISVPLQFVKKIDSSKNRRSYWDAGLTDLLLLEIQLVGRKLFLVSLWHGCCSPLCVNRIDYSLQSQCDSLPPVR